MDIMGVVWFKGMEVQGKIWAEYSVDILKIYMGGLFLIYTDVSLQIQ